MSELLQHLPPREAGGFESLAPHVRIGFRFVTAGLLNTIFGYSVYTVLIIAGLGYMPALAIATLAGVMFNFQTSRRLVFHVPGRFVRFVLLYGAIFLINYVALRSLIQLGASELTAQAALVLPAATCSFLGQRFFIFRESEGRAGPTIHEPVFPHAHHDSDREHWLLADGWLATTWRRCAWDARNRVWLDGGRQLTPEKAARKKWRYSGPVVSAAELPLPRTTVRLRESGPTD
jgi:putative flippase GtrA